MAVNPFRYSGPVSSDDLIGRDVESARLLATAWEGNNSRLVAPRRFGKTSLLRRVLAEAQAEGWQGVYVDFFGVLTLADVAGRIERSYTQALRGPAARWFDGVRRALRPGLRAGALGVPLSVEVDLSPQMAPLLDRLALPRKIHERWGARVLVVFDEFQGVLSAQPNADEVIRSEIQHHGEAASYIFAGSEVGMMDMLFRDRRRALYAQAAPVELPPLPSPETAEFIAARFADSGRGVGEALGPLLDLTAGHPQRTMLVAHALWEATPDGAVADETTIATAVDKVMDDLLGEFEIIWRDLPVGHRRVLALVASDEERPYARTSSVGGSKGSAVHNALGSLVGRGEIVRERSRTSGYRLVDPLLAAWVRAGRSEVGPFV